MKSAIYLLVFLFASSAALAQNKPNIVHILVDNWGWADIRIQGGSIPTPRIDALAQQGLRMTNFNVENQCVPTRSAIMTGRLPVRSGTHRVTYGLPYGMAPFDLEGRKTIDREIVERSEAYVAKQAKADGPFFPEGQR